MATTCNITDGFDLDCMDSLGGIKAAWILGVSGSVAPSISSITKVTGQATVIAGTGTFYKFDLAKDTASFTNTGTITPANGTSFFTGELTMIFHKMDATKRNQIMLLAKNRKMYVVFQDANGNYYLMGETRGCQLSAAAAQTGTATGDSNQWSLTIQSIEPDPALPLSGSLSTVATTPIVVEA